ncbi:MAG: hypothetical protein RIQ56_638 [Candidatus Parcubacteria bacterium]|jgi:cell shape-determining protein MreC
MAKYASYKSIRTPPRERRTLIAVSLFIVFLFLTNYLTGGLIRSSIHGAVSSAFISIHSLQESLLGPNPLESRTALEARVATLENELAQLRSREIGVSAIYDENAELKKLLSVVGDEKGMTASVLFSSAASPYGTFIIAAGSAEGVEDGSLVQTADGYIIGEIHGVNTHTSVVRELFAPGSTLPGVVGTTTIALEGRGGGNARGQAVREANVSVGGIVKSQQVHGLPIGVVGEVLSDPGNTYTEVFVRYPVNLATLRYVYVIPPRK